MKKIILLLFLTGSMNVIGQRIEFIGGINRNMFYTFTDTRADYTSFSSTGIGFVSRIGFEFNLIRRMNMRFTLSYNEYHGDFEASTQSPAFEHVVIAETDKSVISLGVFPFNFNLFHRLNLNVGCEISRLLTEDNQGTISGHMIGELPYSDDINERYSSFNSLIYVGVRGRIAYDLKISKSLVISPQYSYYLGLSNEFKYFPDFVKSKQHHICIGIEKTF